MGRDRDRHRLSRAVPDGSESAFVELTKKRPMEREIVIETAYLIPAKEGIDNAAEMIERGVRVRILTNSMLSNNHPTVHAHYKKYRKRMIEAGIELYELRPDPEILEHFKESGEPRRRVPRRPPYEVLCRRPTSQHDRLVQHGSAIPDLEF